MKFESIEHALHYAAGSKIEILIYSGKVVDVTEFKEKHPGGAESINKWIGKDITYAFDKVESHKTKTAMRDIEQFTIGEIKLNSDNKPILTEGETDTKIDLKKGIIWQVFTKMNKQEYLDFIHDPKHMINPPEAIMFDTPYLEIFTKTPWYVIPMLWVPLILYYLIYSFLELEMSIFMMMICYFYGILHWTLIEYVLHRFVFHLDDKLPDNRFALLFHFLFHGIHHAFPMDRNRLVFPPVAAFPLYKLVMYSLFLLFGPYYPCVGAGTLTGYIMYDLTHYFIHHNKPKVNYFKNLKQYHVLHHYKNPKKGFGVSNKIWDYVFDTLLRENEEKDT